MPVPDDDMDDSDDTERYMFSARMDNARNLTNVLKAIHFKDVSKEIINRVE